MLVCISGRKNKLRVYYLSWLRNKIVKGDDVSVYWDGVSVYWDDVSVLGWCECVLGWCECVLG